MSGPENQTSETVKKPERKVYKAAVIDTSRLVEAQARDIGDHRMTESKEDRSQGWVKRTINRVWKHNLAQEVYRQRAIGSARQEILTSGNLYAGEKEGQTARNQEAMGAIIDRFTSEYDMEMLKEQERESKQMVSPEANAQLRDWIKEYAVSDPKMDIAAFTEGQTRILSAINPEYVAGGRLYADNILEIANNVRDSVIHGAKIEEMDFEVQLTLGKARESLNTEAQMHTFDRVTEKLQNSKIGRFIANSPALIAIGAGVYQLAKVAGLSALRSNVVKAFTFGGSAFVAGGVAGFKESARLERERAQHMRESAKGMTFDEDAKRREQMDQNRYETRPAKSYIDSLTDGLTKINAGKVEAADAQGIMQNLAELESRIKLGDSMRSDFIEYSRFDQVEQERTQLDLLRAKLKVALRKDPEVQKISGGNFNEYLSNLSTTEGNTLDTEVATKDRIFKKMKRGKVSKAVLLSAAFGAAAGVVGQEVFADVGTALGGHTDGFLSGLIKSSRHFFGKAPGTTPTEGLSQHATILEALRRHMTGEAPRMPLGHEHEMLLAGSNTHIKLPEGVEIHANPNGTYDIVRNGEIIAPHEHIAFDKNGDLTPDARTALAKHDIFATFSQVHGTVNEAYSESPADYIKETAGTHNPRVHRELWYDNDTPKPVFDKNELKEWWGGVHNTGLDKDGNYVLDMKHMMPKGSFHADQSVDAPATIKHPGLKMLFSMTKDTQHQPFELLIGPDAMAIVPKGDPIAKMFETVNGHAVFKGQFAEVAQSMGTAPDGGENVRILSTVVGEGLKTFEGVHAVPTTIPTVSLDVPDGWDVIPPPFIPVPLARQPLERGEYEEHKVKPVNLGYYFGGYHTSPEQGSSYKETQSPTLLGNPDAQLNAKSEIDSYLSREDKEHAEKVKLLAAQAGPMNPDCKLSICIPVAGHQEENDIERTLSAYLNQQADPKSFEVVLFINQPKADRDGYRIDPDGTAQKVEEFRVQHPELNVRVMNLTLPTDEARIGNIRKLLNDATLLRSSERGPASDLIMVSNDADTRGIAPEYIQNFIDRFDENPNVDAALGQLDWDPESYIRNPLIHVGTRLFQYLDIQARRNEGNVGSSGANFAFKSSIYAAVGGYNGETEGGEDVDLGRRIKLAREDASVHTMPIMFGGARVSRLYTSSRRAEKVLQDGLAPIEQWNPEFTAFDDDVRKTKWEEIGENPNYDDPEEVRKLIEGVEVIVNRTLNAARGWMSPGEYKTYVRRSLGWLGIKYETLQSNEIKITDASKLIEGLKGYQKDGMEIMARKLGKVAPKKTRNSPRAQKAVIKDGSTTPARRPRTRRQTTPDVTPAPSANTAAAAYQSGITPDV